MFKITIYEKVLKYALNKVWIQLYRVIGTMIILINNISTSECLIIIFLNLWEYYQLFIGVIRMFGNLF